MQALKQFSIPILGLDSGLYQYKFDIDSKFFHSFEYSPYKDGSVKVQLELDKKLDHMILTYSFEGNINLECDRCTDRVDYPILSEHSMIVKYDLEERDEEEVTYIHPDSPEFNCAKLLYEAIILGMPLNKTCDEVVGKDCDPLVMAHLIREEIEEETEKKENPLTEALKNFKIN